MKPEEQRVAIATACGFSPNSYEQSHGIWTPAEIACTPDYLCDLNACHEMEKVLTRDQWWKYFENLQDVMEEIVVQNIIRATAPQRCEAFLKTLGLWVESQ